ncbi:hypothetical protein BIW11_04208 [Tropilaelaps mercedesae]|uniref:Uncharacterized protein n=1 Tax=Tropilaelaps mercedesae TaxID=418985 RepID=A0A1V9X9H1_9ACAR|nr:hypothetical protein BIW11_04208 [Tropilaelaps mercedesae]
MLEEASRNIAKKKTHFSRHPVRIQISARPPDHALFTRTIGRLLVKFSAASGRSVRSVAARRVAVLDRKIAPWSGSRSAVLDPQSTVHLRSPYRRRCSTAQRVSSSGVAACPRIAPPGGLNGSDRLDELCSFLLARDELSPFAPPSVEFRERWPPSTRR